MKVQKTNAARQLDRAGVDYMLVPYEVDEKDLSAVHLAEQLGEDVNRVFKTLVLVGDKTGPIACLVPGADEVDFKKAARLSGNKKCEMLPVKELQPLTGYLRGGCSPFAMKKRLSTYVHESVQGFDTIFVSAGLRGLQIKLRPEDLIEQSQAEVGDLTA